MTDGQSIGLSATAYGFPAEDLEAAASMMSPAGPVEVRPHGRGGGAWDVEILLQFTLTMLITLGPNLAASAIWDGLKFLLLKYRELHGSARPSRLVTIQVREEAASHSRQVEAFIRTDDPEYLGTALNGLPGIVWATLDQSPSEWNYVQYEEAGGGWTPVTEGND